MVLQDHIDLYKELLKIGRSSVLLVDRVALWTDVSKHSRNDIPNFEHDIITNTTNMWGNDWPGLSWDHWLWTPEGADSLKPFER